MGVFLWFSYALGYPRLKRFKGTAPSAASSKASRSLVMGICLNQPGKTMGRSRFTGILWSFIGFYGIFLGFFMEFYGILWNLKWDFSHENQTWQAGESSKIEIFLIVHKPGKTVELNGDL